MSEIISTPTDVVDKIASIFAIIKDIGEDTPEVAAILMDSLSMACRTIQQIGNKGTRDEIDMDEQIDMVTNALGFPIQDIVMYLVQKNFPAGASETMDAAMGSGMGMTSTKEADAATLDFITGDLDDYEKFVASAKAKESLDFLKDQL